MQLWPLRGLRGKWRTFVVWSTSPVHGDATPGHCLDHPVSHHRYFALVIQTHRGCVTWHAACYFPDTCSSRLCFSYRTLMGKCDLGVGLDWDEIEQVTAIESAFEPSSDDRRMKAGRRFSPRAGEGVRAPARRPDQ